MLNIDKWRPRCVIRDGRSGRFGLDRSKIYGGSLYIAALQQRMYLPVFTKYLSGSLLDIGCGPVPYFEVYRSMVTENICVDYPGSVHGLAHLDHLVDMNESDHLPFQDDRFDSVLATDMIAHMQRPDAFIKEVARVLRPGGKAIITSSFVNWMGEYPNEYFHPSGPGLRYLAQSASLEVLYLESYGGHVDVFMDTLNKFMHSGIRNRLFLLLARLVEFTGWPERNRRTTKDQYALGNVMVVRKPGPHDPSGDDRPPSALRE